jgi:tetratricopeptide (TPR) repeat protein
VDEAVVGRNGRFQLRNIPPGFYSVKIVNLRGDVIKESYSNIHENIGSLSLQIPSPGAIGAPQGMVSVARLLRPIPHKAEQEFVHAQKASQDGQMQQSLEHLQRAIQIFPEYSEAHNNLGARYLKMGQLDKALQEFQTTIALDPAFVMAQINLGVALINKVNYPQAEAAARRALQLEPQSRPAHYVLGQALFLQKKNLPEAIASLRQSVETFPKARLLIAELLVRQGAISDAAVELRLYLASKNAEQREFAQSWLAALER